MVRTKGLSMCTSYKFRHLVMLMYSIPLNSIRALLIASLSFKFVIFSRFWESWTRVEFRCHCCCKTIVFWFPSWLFRLSRSYTEACQWPAGSESGSYRHHSATYCITVYCGMFPPTVDVTARPLSPGEFLPPPGQSKWKYL